MGEELFKSVNDDIEEIDVLLSHNATKNELLDLHRRLDGKYQAAIVNWGIGFYNYNELFGFNYNYIDEETLSENLSLMRAKIDAFRLGLNRIENTSKAQSPGVNLTINNSISITISIEEAKQKIDDMPGLTDENAEELKQKIDEIDSISREDISKKKKWEKIKPILHFVLDKGADVAIVFMGLVMQMKLGI